MFKAIGIGVRKLDTGDLEVTVSLQKDDGTEVGRAVVTGIDVPTVRAKILTELTRRAQNEQDATLSALVVGKLLGQV